MTAQQARTITIIQNILGVLAVASFAAGFRWPEWEATSEGLSFLLWGGFLLTLFYRVRLETGRWYPASMAWMLGGCVVLSLVHWLT